MDVLLLRHCFGRAIYCNISDLFQYLSFVIELNHSN